MSKNRLLLISILILLASLASCTVSKNTTSNKNKWLEHQFKSLNYIDTADSKTKVNDLFIDGLVCQMQNHNSAAILCFQDALKYGSNSIMHYEIAKSYSLLKKYNFTIKSALHALEIDRDFIPAYILLSEAYLESNDLQNSIFSLESIIKSNDIDDYIEEEVLIGLAKIYAFQNINKSLNYYNQIANKFKNQDALLNLLQIYKYKIDNDSLYSKTVDAVNLNHIDNPELINEIADYYINNYSFDKLLNVCSIADSKLCNEELISIYSNILAALSDSLIIQEVPDSIKRSILNFIDYRFDINLTANFYAGQLALSLNDTVLADKYFNNVFKYKDTSYYIPLQTALLYKKYNYTNKYLSILDDFSNKNISCIFPFYLGIYYLNENKPHTSLDYLKKAALYNDNKFKLYAAQIYDAMAEVYESINDDDNAYISYQSGYDLDSLDPHLNNNYAYYLCRHEIDLEKAYTLSKSSIDLNNDNAANWDTYGWILYKLNRYYEALDAILKSIELSSEANIEIYEHLYEVYIKLEQYENAEKIKEQIKDLLPKS